MGLQPCVAGRPQEDAAHQGRLLTMPPSTGTMAPVTYDAAGDSRNVPSLPTSAGSPYRPSGIRAITDARTSPVVVPVRAAVASSTSRIRGVVNRPGAMPLIRIGAISAVRDLISPTRPGRIVFEAVSPGMGS